MARHPNAFFSKKLRPTQHHYSSFRGELLAVYSSLGNFRHFLKGVEFFILTDYKPVTYALRSMRSDGSMRMAYIFSKFTTDIHHVKGRDNIAADALSQSNINGINNPEGVNFDVVAAA